MLFTFFADYHKGTFISQVEAQTINEAKIKWAKGLNYDLFGIKNINLFLNKIQSEDYISVENVKNICCFCVRIKKKLAIIHVIPTISEVRQLLFPAEIFPQ